MKKSTVILIIIILGAILLVFGLTSIFKGSNNTPPKDIQVNGFDSAMEAKGNQSTVKLDLLFNNVFTLTYEGYPYDPYVIKEGNIFNKYNVYVYALHWGIDTTQKEAYDYLSKGYRSRGSFLDPDNEKINVGYYYNFNSITNGFGIHDIAASLAAKLTDFSLTDSLGVRYRLKFVYSSTYGFEQLFNYIESQVKDCHYLGDIDLGDYFSIYNEKGELVNCNSIKFNIGVYHADGMLIK